MKVHDLSSINKLACVLFPCGLVRCDSTQTLMLGQHPGLQQVTVVLAVL